MTLLHRQFNLEHARRGREVAEAMLAQLVALEGRLAKPQLAPAGVLDDVERASKSLHNKAFRRVRHATSIRPTEAPGSSSSFRPISTYSGALLSGPASCAICSSFLSGRTADSFTNSNRSCAH